MQRISLAIGCSFRPEILLLDGTHTHFFSHLHIFLSISHLYSSIQTCHTIY